METGETGVTAFNISGGGGGAPAFGVDLTMQGSGCWDKPCSAAERGIGVNKTPGTGTVAAGVHIFQWGFCATPGITDTLAIRGIYLICGTSTANFMQFHVDGLDTLGAQGRVGKCYVYDYQTTAQTDRVPYATSNGTPGATPTYFGYGLKTTATAKGSNIGMDAVRYGTGGFLTAGELVSAGDAGDDPCSFAGFNTDSDALANRWGILTGVGPGSYELQGKFVIGQNNAGTATLCRFRDSDKSITVVDTVHSEAGFTEFIFDHASTRSEWTNINITAAGGWNKGIITVTSNDPDVFITGGTFTGIGVSTLQVSTTADGTTWRAAGTVTANGATLANSAIIYGASMIDAQDETSYDNSPTTEGAFSGGTGHVAGDILTLDDDTVIVVDLVSGGVVTQFTVDATRSKVFSGVRTQVLSDATGIDFTLTPDTDNYTESASLIWDTAADPNGELDDMTFDTLTSAMGHAIQFGTTSPLTMTLTGIDFGTNYSGTANGSVGNETFEFLRTTGTITVNLVGCSGNFGYKKEAGATVVINNAVSILIGGVAEGTAVKCLANETVGTITKDDVLDEQLADSAGEVTWAIDYEGAFEPSGLDILIRAYNQGFPNAAIADDGTVQTDETTNSNSPATNDMILTPAVPVVNDAYYFGHNEEFSQLKVWVTTAGVNQTITWEYWNGAWVALSGVTDGTSSFTSLGDNIVSWTAPSDWVDTTINTQGPFRFVRARVSAIGGGPTGAQARQCQLDVTRYLPIPPSGDLVRTITSSGLTATLAQAVDSIAKPFG